MNIKEKLKEIWKFWIVTWNGKSLDRSFKEFSWILKIRRAWLNVEH